VQPGTAEKIKQVKQIDGVTVIMIDTFRIAVET
jgi:hypothetical protein